MSEAVKWGIISTAHINRLVIPGAHESPKVDLVGVASRDRARAETYAREWEIPRAYGSYEELLEDPEIEAVYISLPNTMHCDWSIRAVEAGKHVLCEKPLSRHPEEIEAAFDAADRAGRLLSEAFMYRHNPQTKRLKQLVDDGAIGELRLVRTSFSYSLYDADNIRLRTDVEGGALMDVGCYCVSGSRLLGGEPESVYGQAFVGETGTDWVFTAQLRFPDDVLALFDCGTRDAGPRRARGGRQRGLALPRRSVALPGAGDRAAARRRRRADRARARRLVPARAGEPQRRDPRRGRAAARARGRARTGTHARGAAPFRRDEPAGRMLTEAEQNAARKRAAAVLADTGIALTPAETDAIEVADFGLSQLDVTGLEVVVYVNTERVCAKELVMFPRQLCPEHRHPPFDGTPGKEETFRCRAGVVYLYTEGEPVHQPAARVPEDGVFTVWHEVVLQPGEQHTIAPEHAALVPGGRRRRCRLGVLDREP